MFDHMNAEEAAEKDAPCAGPKPFVDFSGNTYGAHQIAQNLGGVCPYCGVEFEFWGRATPPTPPAAVDGGGR